MNFRRLSILVLLAIFLISCQNEDPSSSHSISSETLKARPYEFLFLQRSYPHEKLDLKAYLNGLELAQSGSEVKSNLPGFDREWRTRGPANIGARVNTVAVDYTNPNIIYAGFSSGGVFKTINGGADWIPIFDDQAYLAIGDITIDPSDPQTIYVGTGDPNISGYPFIGNGLFKSTDGGQSWIHLGLEPQRIISRILIDPANPDIIYAACMGIPFERNVDRGLYKSTNGGLDWTQVLFVSEQSGIIDLVMDPNDSQVLYAAAWDRIRNNMESTIAGPNAKIFKTLDGGASWTMLEGGLPQDSIGRIGLAISATNSQKLYALYVGLNRNLHNIYLTEDGGNNWTPIIPEDNSSGLSTNALGGFGWFFGKIRVNPQNDDDLFLLGVELWRRRVAGGQWEIANPLWWQYEVHADKHDLVFNNGVMTLATDGGLYQSYDDAANWIDIERIPTTQFYRVGYNPHRTDWYYGGAQDNGTTGGPDINTDWLRIYSGDGFQTLFHPENPDYFYAEIQSGGIVVTDNGGLDWYDATDGINGNDRRNWDMPVIMSAHDPNVLYTGTYRVYKSTAGLFPDWMAISEDLTDGLILHPRFHTISTLCESPINQDLLYAGTTDGNVSRSLDGGQNWENISFGLPNRYVTDIKASADIEHNVYVSHSGYKDNEFTPRIFRSTDRGTTWEDISGNLPDLAINDIYILPGHQDTVLFAATDGGVYGTLNGGEEWGRLGTNMPMVAVYDMEWNVARNELIAGTYARSIMTYPLDSIGVEPMDSTVAANDVILESRLSIYPSPARDFIRINGVAAEMQVVNLTIMDKWGRVVLSSKTNNYQLKNKTLAVNNLVSGLYFLVISSANQRQTGSFIKL